MTHHNAVATVAGFALAVGLLTAAGATPARSTLLGLSHRVLSAGSPLTVELTFKPRQDFDRIAVEPGSGVKTLSPDCHFEGVTAHGPYVCRVEVSGTASDAYLTLNVVGTTQPPGNAAVQTEVQHLTFRNGSFRKSTPTQSVHRLTPPQS